MRSHVGWGRVLASVATAALLGGTVFAAESAAQHHAAPAVRVPADLSTLPPCAQEDDGDVYACWWDASSRGNGLGRSFVALPGAGGHAVTLFVTGGE